MDGIGDSIERAPKSGHQLQQCPPQAPSPPRLQLFWFLMPKQLLLKINVYHSADTETHNTQDTRHSTAENQIRFDSIWGEIELQQRGVPTRRQGQKDYKTTRLQETQQKNYRKQVNTEKNNIKINLYLSIGIGIN